MVKAAIVGFVIALELMQSSPACKEQQMVRGMEAASAREMRSRLTSLTRSLSRVNRSVFVAPALVANSAVHTTSWNKHAARAPSVTPQTSQAVQEIINFVSDMETFAEDKLLDFVKQRGFRVIKMPKAVLTTWIDTKMNDHNASRFHEIDGDTLFLSGEAMCFTNIDPALVVTDGGKVMLDDMLSRSKEICFPIAYQLIKQLRYMFVVRHQAPPVRIKAQNILCWAASPGQWNFCFLPGESPPNVDAAPDGGSQSCDRNSAEHRKRRLHVGCQDLLRVVNHIKRSLLGLPPLYEDDAEEDFLYRYALSEALQWAAQKLQERNGGQKGISQTAGLLRSGDPWYDSFTSGEQQMLRKFVNKQNNFVERTQQQEKKSAHNLPQRFQDDVGRLENVAQLLAKGDLDGAFYEAQWGMLEHH